ncbi:helix-turn-helix domain-containing protein [Candidatus Poriferisodalis sp.]|uniref:helix-turn-helix domain-containing protein n=1 Tax=Candidatus Poriferisodalis sp. TaxID=3101277 RepID=UPI003B014A43
MTYEVVVLSTPGSVRRCVRYLRRHRGWNQAQLAEAVGRSQQWVSKFESGRCEASLGDVMAALSALGAGIAVRPAEAHRGTVEHG